jgi:hypothetical protein
VKNLHAINMAFAVLSIPLSLLGQTGTKPVPEKWLHDGWLLVPEFNFSINSPSGDAKWSYKDDFPKVDGSGSIAFLVDVGDGNRYSLTVQENGETGPTDPDQFIIGMRKTTAVQNSAYDSNHVTAA